MVCFKMCKFLRPVLAFHAECHQHFMQNTKVSQSLPVIITPVNLTFQLYPSYLKMPGPISQNDFFYSNDASSPRISWFQISLKSVKPFGHKKRLCILRLPTPYCVSLIMVTISHFH